jgi:hypothetical protein
MTSFVAKRRKINLLFIMNTPLSRSPMKFLHTFCYLTYGIIFRFFFSKKRKESGSLSIAFINDCVALRIFQQFLVTHLLYLLANNGRGAAKRRSKINTQKEVANDFYGAQNETLKLIDRNALSNPI